MKCPQICAVLLCFSILSNLTAKVSFLQAEEPSPAVPSEAALKDQNDPNKIVARVHGSEISLKQLDEEVRKRPSYAQYLDPQGGNDAARHQVRSMVLGQMIDRKLLVDSASKSNIMLSDDELNQMYDASIQRFGDSAKLEIFLKGMGLTNETFKQELRSDILITKYIQEVLVKDLSFSDEQLKGNYEANKANYALGEAVHVRHILVKVDPAAAEADLASAKTKIDQLYQKVTKPNADFSEVAKSDSDCPSAAKGGDLDFIEKGQTVKEFEQAAFALKPGEISKPVKTQFGFHIIKQEEHRDPRQLGYDEVKPMIEQRLRQEKSGEIVKTKLEALRKSEGVEILL